jgi:hypothetical protein
MDIKGVQKELRMEGIADWLKIKTTSGKTAAQQAPWSSNPKVLQRRTDQIAALRQSKAILKLGPLFDTIAKNEAEAQKPLDPANEFAEECYGQLLFTGEYFKPLNYIPFLLTVLRFWKIYLNPAVTVSMPLIAIVMPYIILRFVMNIPMPISVYIGIVKEVYTGNGFKGLLPSAPHLEGGISDIMRQADQAPSMDIFGKLKFYAQAGWTLFSVGQAMWQPIQAAKHLYSLDEVMYKQGEALINVYNAASNARELLLECGFKVEPLPIDCPQDARQAVATALESPARVRLLFTLIGHWELLYSLANCKDICLVKWIKSRTPSIKLTKTFDIHVDESNRVPISIDMTNSRHALLTGPNRGGKSTALRAVGRSIFMAHCFGVAIGRRAIMTPLKWMQTCLRLEDIPGSASLFEREVAVAALALNRAQTPKSRGIVLIDELFHSTNPPDAEIASRQFLNGLWGTKQTMSIISTHMFQLLDETDERGIQQVCCPAVYRQDGSVKYFYGLRPGICKVSSVREILKEQGLRPSS